MAEQIPAGIPQGVRNLIQTNMLSRELRDGLRPFSFFRQDAERKRLEPHSGETITHSKVGVFDVDLRPMATATGDPDLATFPTEQYTAKPLPYSKGFRIDAPTAYVQAGDYALQGMTRLGEWAGRTISRLARGKLFGYAGGLSFVRTAGANTDTTLLVNSLLGFRHQVTVNGLLPVSVSNPLAIKIGAADNTVTGTTPADADFPDGPGTLTLGTALTGAVAAQTIVKAVSAPFVVRAGGRTSSETLVATDIPKVKDLLAARAWLIGRGVPRHKDGTYHVHIDETFMPGLSQDTQWQTALQGAGPVSFMGAVGLFVPSLGLTFFEANDNPAYGRGVEVAVGATPGSSKSMKDLGLDVLNSSGVGIRRALMTGAEVMIETYVDQRLYWSEMGIVKVADLNSSLATYQMGGGNRFIAGELDGWIFTILPALDPRQLFTTFAVSQIVDYTLPTDINGATGGNSTLGTRPIKRAVVIEYGNDEQ